jgi:threonine dehydrogenase-like Zn-dependent dehydrogenase
MNGPLATAAAESEADTTPPLTVESSWSSMKMSKIEDGPHAIPSDKHILIIGAGLVGSLAALLFADRGFTVTVAEKRPGNNYICI